MTRRMRKMRRRRASRQVPEKRVAMAARARARARTTTTKNWLMVTATLVPQSLLFNLLLQRL
jgi:hypothetical protein